MSVCVLCAGGITRVFDGVLECYSHEDTDNQGQLRVCMNPWSPDGEHWEVTHLNEPCELSDVAIVEAERETEEQFGNLHADSYRPAA